MSSSENVLVRLDEPLLISYLRVMRSSRALLSGGPGLAEARIQPKFWLSSYPCSFAFVYRPQVGRPSAVGGLPIKGLCSPRRFESRLFKSIQIWNKEQTKCCPGL